MFWTSVFASHRRHPRILRWISAVIPVAAVAAMIPVVIALTTVATVRKVRVRVRVAKI